MTKHARGNATRARILAELRRRRDAWEPPPTQQELSTLLGIAGPAVLYHLRVLRASGLVHPDGAVITRAGYSLPNS